MIARPEWFDTSNAFQVRASGDTIFFNPFPGRMACRLTKAQAVNLAAWLVVVADPEAKEFERVVKQIVKS